MNSRLTLVTNTDGNFVAAQKGNPGSITINELKELTEISKEKGAVIRNIIKDKIEKWLKNSQIQLHSVSQNMVQLYVKDMHQFLGNYREKENVQNVDQKKLQEK